MTCPRCEGSMFPEQDWYGSYATCLCCGNVVYPGGVIEAEKAWAEMTTKTGRRRAEPMHRGRPV